MPPRAASAQNPGPAPTQARVSEIPMRKPASHLTRHLAPATVVGVSVLFSALPAQAHFVLKSPTAWATQDGLGNPQKSAPCGQADPGTPATATGSVSAFRPGDTVTVTIDETVFHPGHYRVLLATNRSELPEDPPVTAGDTPCGSTTIAAAPAFPLLVDGALKHTAAFSGPQSIQVKLPSDVTCEKCTLQVVEFMSSHGLNNPGGCFYHHCADISIGPQGPAGGSGGTPSGGTAGEGGNAGFGGANSGGTPGRGGGSSGGSAGEGGRNVAGDATVGGGGLGASGQLGFAGSAAAGSPTDAGCSCRTPGRSRPRLFEMLCAFAGIALVRARRR